MTVSSAIVLQAPIGLVSTVALNSVGHRMSPLTTTMNSGQIQGKETHSIPYRDSLGMFYCSPEAARVKEVLAAFSRLLDKIGNL